MIGKHLVRKRYHPDGGIYEVVQIYYQIGIICEVLRI